MGHELWAAAPMTLPTRGASPWHPIGLQDFTCEPGHLMASEFQVQPETPHKDRSAIFVVTRMDNELHVRRNVQAAPQMGSVVGFENIFTSVVQPPVAQQKALSAQRQVLLVSSGNRVAHENEAYLVPGPVPGLRPPIPAQCHGLVDLSVRKALILALIPSYSAEAAQRLGELVLEIQAEA